MLNAASPVLKHVPLQEWHREKQTKMALIWKAMIIQGIIEDQAWVRP